jgi:hypothetical protein
MISFRTIASCVATLALVSGCGGPANEYDAVVTGTVTIDGELANSGLVTFHPVDDGKVTIGRIHPNGSFSLRTGQGDLREVDGGTVVPGEYIVTVSITGPGAPPPGAVEGAPPTPGPSLVAAKYASKETSDLKHTIKPGSQVIVLELERAEVFPAEETTEEEADAAGEAADESAASDTEADAKPGASAETTEVQAAGSIEPNSSAAESSESVNATTGEGTNP